MTRATSLALVAVAAGVCVAGASAQSVAVRAPQAIVARAATAGDIHGVVVDTSGRPLAGAVVSALGSTVAFAMTGKDGRFRLGTLPLGPYAVRIHLDGFAPSPRRMVEVRPDSPALISVALQSLADPRSAKPGIKMAAAGLGPAEMFSGKAANPATDDTNISEAAWRLRHLKRSVMKDVGQADAATDAAGTAERPAAPPIGRVPDPAPRFGSGLFGAVPITGQVNIVTIGSFNGLSDVWSPNSVASAGVAYLSIGAPAGRVGDWAVRGAWSQGGRGSWFVAGSLNARESAGHRYVAGFTYSAQRYDRAVMSGIPDLSSGSRAVATAHASDEWAISRRVSLGYGLTYSWQDYMSGNGQLSPRLSLTLRPSDTLTVRTVAARYLIVPGVEEFTPGPGGGRAIILPAQRTFSPWSETAGFRPQRTDLYELSVEHNVGDFVVGVRAFYQRVGDQAGAVFALPTPDHPSPSLGHYYVTSVGDMNSRGWAIRLSRPLIGGIRAVIDYSQTTTRWDRLTDQSLIALPTIRPNDGKVVHDLTTSLETEIRPTLTRLYVLYKFNTGFVRQDAGGQGFDTRFDIQVNQSLPFLNFASADWELLVAVCNLFRDSSAERSVYDELLVLRPPKRVVGGVRVRF